MKEYMRKIARKIKSRLQQTFNPDPHRYRYISKLGWDSSNSWIQKSSEIGGWLFPGEHEFIYSSALHAPEGSFIEIGSLFGKSTCILAGALKDSGKKGKVFAIDPFTIDGNDNDKRIHLETHGKLNTYSDFVTAAKKQRFFDSIVSLSTYSNKILPFLHVPVSLAFIDGCHEKKSVLEDFDLIMPLLVPGALVLFHDASDTFFPGVGEAIEIIIQKYTSFKKNGHAGTIVRLIYSPS